MPTQDFLVCSENLSLLREMLGKAAQEAQKINGRVHACYFGNESSSAADLAQAGANVVHTISGELKQGDAETVTSLLSALFVQVQPIVVLLGATKSGMEIAPRIAQRNQAAYAASVINFEVDASGAVRAQSVLYTGLGLDKIEFKPGSAVLTVAPGEFAPLGNAQAQADVQSITIPEGSTRVEITAYKPKTGSSARLEEAKAIVDLGQGVKQKEDLPLFNDLAAAIDGLVACSRPLASDRDWFPEWLGLSGKKVRPEICFAIGISGAVQHIVGVRDSRLIVAVNNDENAGVFLNADYGVVADMYEFIPALLERMKARGIRSEWIA